MRIKVLKAMVFFLFYGSFCNSQPVNGQEKPPTMKQRIRMVNEKICTPLHLDKYQTKKMDAAFKEFFNELDKLIDKRNHPPTMPEKTKVDGLAKIRDEKVKMILPSGLLPKYLELEMALRPKQHPKERFPNN